MKVFTYHHCNEWNIRNSMDLADTFYLDTEDGRKRLLEDIIEDVKDGSVEIIGDVGFLNLDILSGNIRNANYRLKNGYINVLEEAR